MTKTKTEKPYVTVIRINLTVLRKTEPITVLNRIDDLLTGSFNVSGRYFRIEKPYSFGTEPKPKPITVNYVFTYTVTGTKRFGRSFNERITTVLSGIRSIPFTVTDTDDDYGYELTVGRPDRFDDVSDDTVRSGSVDDEPNDETESDDDTDENIDDPNGTVSESDGTDYDPTDDELSDRR
jgi:hypothetical protein